MFLRIKRYAVIALSIVGSATLLFSCGKKPNTTLYDNETLMTESSENRTITMMENGKRSYTFTSPLMEGYRLATNPYQEFRRGIEMTTYTDSLSLPEVTITANYAIYYERQKLWEAKGNVVVIRRDREEGDTTVKGLTEVYTQQLFWNATTKKIYSNVDTKVLQSDGWHFGVGFDADDDLKNIHFRRYSSEIEFDFSESEQSDTTKRDVIKMAKEEETAERESRSGNKGGKPAKDASNIKGREERTRPNFVAPTPNNSNTVRPTDPMKPVGTMQLDANSRNPISPTSDRAMRPENKPARGASKQNGVGDKPTKVELNADASGDKVVKP
ncbi:MAG: LPS export ABC transporter periplasmic protein LptC [Alistipes sp.]|nr:LPS export ABC transporter periplasmic protein LptC [Alistipes sp.]